MAQMSVLRYKFLILDTFHQGTLYLRKQGCEDPWLFFETKGVFEQKSWGNTALMQRTVTEVLLYTRVLHVAGTAVTQWLRRCATNRKVAGSIPAGVIGIFTLT